MEKDPTKDITQDNIRELLESFSKTIYRSRDAEPGSLSHDVMEKCLHLFKLDYDTVEISNHGGELSAHYPSLIVIPENEKQKIGSFTPPPTLSTPSANSTTTQQRTQQQTIYENSYDPVKLREMINKSRFARSRTRFPVPVILYKGKYICRSSTLSCGPEMYTRSGINYFFNGSPAAATSPVDDVNTDDPDVVEINESFRDDQENNPKSNSDWPLFDQTRSQDIKLLKTFNVGTIIDFMVEKKKVKFGLKVTSSEKVDKEKRYQEFTICSLPYPGCEFFRQFRDNDYTHENLVFDWSQTHVNADIGIPMDTITLQLQHINWDQYKAWDLAQITQNYMKLVLKYLQDNSSGLLIHCISGWDRTPLFVSMLRLTLWADGVIHQSLNAEQILFLTIAYDWYLFGHDLPDRLSKGEEIFVFCFYALKHLLGDEFSVINRHRTKHNSSGSSSIVVLPHDSDSNGETFQFDMESNGGSSISLSSADSQQDIYQKLQQNDPSESVNGNIAQLNMNQDSNSSIEILSEPPVLNSYSPLPKRKTSPVTVPLSISRQRNESTSSVGSWQMVNQSGSLRSTDSGYLLHKFNSNLDTNGTSTDDDIFSRNHGAALIRRRDRLNSIRSTFYACYCRAVGFKYKNHTELTFASMWQSLSEVVGLPRMQ